MSEQIFKYDPEEVDFERLILSKELFSKWAGVSRFAFTRYVRAKNLTQRDRLGLIRGLNKHIDNCVKLKMLLGEQE